MKTRYTAVFEFEGDPPSVCKTDGWMGGELCSISFDDDTEALRKLKIAAEHVMRDFESSSADSITELADLIGWEFSMEDVQS